MSDKIFINTSQNVNIDYNLAEIWDRIAARLLDLLFMFLYYLVLALIFSAIVSNANLSAFEETTEYFFIYLYVIGFILFSPTFFYSLYFPYFMQGQTPGKRIMKIRIVKEDGTEASFGTYLARWLLNLIDFDLPFIGSILGLIVMVSTKKRQRIADLIAKTLVISVKPKVQINQTLLAQIAEDYQPVFGQALQLSDKDVRIIRQNLEQAKYRKDYKTLANIRRKIEEITQEYRPDMRDTDYIETMLKDYRYFSER